MVAVYAGAIVALCVYSRWIWLHTRRLQFFLRVLLLLLQALMIASIVAAAYYHVGKRAELSLEALGLTIAVTAIIALYFKDRIDLDDTQR